MSKQIGRNVYHENRIERVIKLSLLSKVVKKYYELRMNLLERKIHKYGNFAAGHQHELFNAAVYMKQAYLHKIEALFKWDELRMLKREWKWNKKKSETSSKIKKVRKRAARNE